MPWGAPDTVSHLDTKTVVQVFDALLEGKNPHPCRCELQRERQTVDTPADGDDVFDLRWAQVLTVKRQLCAVTEELDHLGFDQCCDAFARFRKCQGREAADPFTLDSEGLPAGGQ